MAALAWVSALEGLNREVRVIFAAIVSVPFFVASARISGFLTRSLSRGATGRLFFVERGDGRGARALRALVFLFGYYVAVGALFTLLIFASVGTAGYLKGFSMFEIAVLGSLVGFLPRVAMILRGLEESTRVLVGLIAPLTTVAVPAILLIPNAPRPAWSWEGLAAGVLAGGVVLAVYGDLMLFALGRLGLLHSRRTLELRSLESLEREIELHGPDFPIKQLVREIDQAAQIGDNATFRKGERLVEIYAQRAVRERGVMRTNLSELGQAADRPLMKCAESGDFELQLGTLRALAPRWAAIARYDANGPKELLLRAIRSEKDDIRTAALRGLRELHNSIPIGERFGIVTAVLVGLETKAPDAPTLEALKTARAFSAVAGFGQDAVASLLQVLCPLAEHGSEPVRVATVETISEFDDAFLGDNRALATNTIVARLVDQSVAVRSAAVTALDSLLDGIEPKELPGVFASVLEASSGDAREKTSDRLVSRQILIPFAADSDGRFGALSLLLLNRMPPTNQEESVERVLFALRRSGTLLWETVNEMGMGGSIQERMATRENEGDEIRGLRVVQFILVDILETSMVTKCRAVRAFLTNAKREHPSAWSLAIKAAFHQGPISDPAVIFSTVWAASVCAELFSETENRDLTPVIEHGLKSDDQAVVWISIRGAFRISKRLESGGRAALETQARARSDVPLEILAAERARSSHEAKDGTHGGELPPHLPTRGL